MLIGARAAEHAKALGLKELRVDQAGMSNGALVGESIEDYWTALAAVGPTLRCVLIEDAGVRLPRRPRFVDLQLRGDDPQRLRRLRRWDRRRTNTARS